METSKQKEKVHQVDFIQDLRTITEQYVDVAEALHALNPSGEYKKVLVDLIKTNEELISLLEEETNRLKNQRS